MKDLKDKKINVNNKAVRILKIDILIWGLEISKSISEPIKNDTVPPIAKKPPKTTYCPNLVIKFQSICWII